MAAQDFALSLRALLALVFWRLPPWLVVRGSAAMGRALGLALSTRRDSSAQR